MLKKCQNKFDCLVNEMLLIKLLQQCLNVQSDSIRAQVLSNLSKLMSLNSNDIFILVSLDNGAKMPLVLPVHVYPNHC